jgi:glycosyltransferase involved in cell wall biosynthesis
VRIIQITPGTGDFHCGCSIRDGALLLELRRQGHAVTCLPLYLPLVTEEGSLTDAPIFYSGISVYLEQKIPFMRRMPAWLDRCLSHPGLLKHIASRADMTSAAEHGDMTLSMLRGENGHQARELEKLIAWIKTNEKPDIIVLSMSLLVGLARQLRDTLNVPVVCSLQGEDAFLDSLPEDIRREAWALVSARLADVDAMIAPTHYYAQHMQQRTGVSADRIHTIYNGLDTAGYEERGQLPSPHRIGFLARVCPAKGIDTLIDAFIHLRTALGDTSTRLMIAGAMTRVDHKHMDAHKARLEKAGLWQDVECNPNVSKTEKQALLSSCSLLSVPADYDEAFGLYMAEALLSGLPVVQPDRGAFPEIVAASGGGLLHRPGDAEHLAQQWQTILQDSELNARLSRAGRAFALREFAVTTMAERMLATYTEICRRGPGSAMGKG